MKADNCFVDSNDRVKVADFGTSLIATSILRQKQPLYDLARVETADPPADSGVQSETVPMLSETVFQPTAATNTDQASVDARGRDRGRTCETLSKGVGSLLWMAPEALRGARITKGQAAALDIYSFSIVMFEIWYVSLDRTTLFTAAVACWTLLLMC